jgi:hypothetical protein
MGHITVHVRKSAELADLLRHAGPWVQRAGLASAATPDNGASTVVTVLEHHAGRVRGELAAALRQARADNHPAVDHLSFVATHIGVVEGQAEPQADPAPEYAGGY